LGKGKETSREGRKETNSKWRNKTGSKWERTERKGQTGRESQTKQGRRLISEKIKDLRAFAKTVKNREPSKRWCNTQKIGDWAFGSRKQTFNSILKGRRGYSF